MFFKVKELLRIAVCCYLISICHISLAQKPTYIPYQADFSDKLNNVRDIYRDSVGFIWISTNYGIVRIDGKRATRLTKFNTTNLKSNSLLRMVRIPSANKYFFHDELGNFLTPDGRGGLLTINESDAYLANITKAHADLNLIRHLAEFQVLPNGECIALEFSGEPVYFFNQKNNWTNFSLPRHSKGRSLVYLSGEVFLSSRGNLGRVSREGYTPVVIKGLEQNQSTNDFEFFSDNQDNGFLISNGQLYRCFYRQNTLEAEIIQGVRGLKDISAILEDPATGLIYIGSRSSDLLIYQVKRFENLFLNNIPNSEPSYYYAPLTTARNEYFFVSDDNLYRWTPTEEEQVFRGINIVAVWIDSLNGLWFSSGDKQISRLQLNDDRRSVEFIANLDGEVRQIGMRDGVFFVLTNNSLYQFENYLSRPLKVKRQFKLFDKLRVNTRTSQVHFLENKEALIAHRDGLIRLDLKTSEVKPFNDLTGINVRNLTFINQLGILAGTYGDGYFLIKDDQVIKMPMDEDGVMEAIHAFIPDDYGSLWMPTNKGLIKVRLGDLQDFIQDNRARPLFELFTEKDGFTSSEFNGGTNPSFAVDGDAIILPSANGLVRFSPVDFIRPNDPIVVPRMVIDGQFVSIPSSLSLLSGESFEIQFEEVAGPNLFNNKIWYRILPSEASWKTLNASERVNLENLLPGNYRIEFLPHTPFGQGQNQAGLFSFKVEPKWYQTSMIYGLSAMAFLFLLWLFFKIRLYYIHQQQKRLQLEIATKTSELNQVNLELTKSNQELNQSLEIIGNQIKFKEKVLLVLLHDLKSPMRFVTSSLRSLFTDLDATSPHKKLSGELVTSLTRIYKFMEDFQNWVLQSETGINKPEFVGIHQMLESIWEFYQQPAAVYGNKITVNSEDLVIKTYSFTLKTIIGNLVDNAVKNTVNGEITLTAYDTESFINIEVSDSGVGMRKDVLERVLHTIESREKIKMPSMGSGVGYRLIGEFITAVNGLIAIESEFGKGTKVTISIRK